MKKTSPLLILSLLISTLLYSQTNGWQWAKATTGPGEQEGFAVASDTAGNVFITGYFHGDSIKFGNTVFYDHPSLAFDEDNLFVAKYDPSGNVLWAASATITDTSGIHGNALATDVAGNVYVTGCYSGRGLAVGTTTFPATPINQTSFFIAKYGPNGNVLWAKTAPGAQDDPGTGITTDAQGNAYVTGGFASSTIQFGSTVLSNAASAGFYREIFIAKYGPNGNVLWAQAPGTPNTRGNTGMAIATDGLGHFYTAGYYGTSTLTFGNQTIAASSNSAGYIAKFDSAGNLIWLKNSGNPSQEPWGIAANAQGFYTTGQFYSDSIYFDTIRLNNNNATSNIGTFNIKYGAYYLVKYDTAGSVIWAKSAAANGGIWPNGPNTLGYSVALGPGGQVFVTGSCVGDTVTFDTTAITYGGYPPDPMFLVVYDSTGKVLCARPLLSGGDDQNAVTVDKYGNAYIGGDFEEINLVAGSDTLPVTSSDGENLFILKFACPNCTTVGNFEYQLSQASLCPGDSVIITFTGTPPTSITPANYVTWVDSLHAVLKPAATTVFTLSGSSACGVLQSQAITIPVAAGTVNITTNQTTICSGDSTLICAPAGYTNYAWSNGQSGPCVAAYLAGPYTVTVTANGQCTATSNTINISTYPVQPVTVSVNGDTLLSASANGYQWFLNGVAITGATSATYIANTNGVYTVQITYAQGCTATSTGLQVTGIEQIFDAAGINIYPNPTHNAWQLNVSPGLTGSNAKVFDATGRLVFESAINSQQSTISLTNSAAGVYELRIVHNNYSVVKKLVKL